MKKHILPITLIFLVAFLVNACNKKPVSNANYFGVFGDSTITEDGAIDVSEIITKLEGSDSISLKVKGKIDQVCQAKGCWMSMNLSEEESMTVKFKDYAFFVPKNSGGREAVLEGMAFVDTISVAELQHFAKDAEESDEEIAKITEPEVKYIFKATGVIIK